MAEVATPSALDSALQIRTWEYELNEEALPNDIFDNLSGNISYESGQKQVALPDKVYLKLSAKADDAHDVVIPLVKDFYGDPQEGDDQDPRGKEEDYIVKNFKMQCNSVSHVHMNVAYGLSARDKRPYQLTQKGVVMEGRYFKQLFGKYRRQTCFEGQSGNLLDYPHYNAAMLNPNCFLPGLDDDLQPKYSTVYQDYVNNIVHGLNNAGTGVNGAISVRFIQRLQVWAFDHLQPLDMEDGKQGFIFIVPSPQVMWLKHPTNERGLGKMLRLADTFDKEVQLRYPGWWGDIDRIRIVEDMRYPTLTIGGVPSASQATHAGTMTIKYRGMGRADDGSSDPRDKSASARQGGILVGANAFCEWFPEKLHIEYDYKCYDKVYGTGPFGVFGSKLVVFNTSGAVHASHVQHQGSVMTWFAAPPREGYSTSFPGV